MADRGIRIWLYGYDAQTGLPMPMPALETILQNWTTQNIGIECTDNRQTSKDAIRH